MLIHAHKCKKLITKFMQNKSLISGKNGKEHIFGKIRLAIL